MKKSKQAVKFWEVPSPCPLWEKIPKVTEKSPTLEYAEETIKKEKTKNEKNNKKVQRKNISKNL